MKLIYAYVVDEFVLQLFAEAKNRERQMLAKSCSSNYKGR